MTGIKRPALRYHGGKFRLAPWVMSFFPPHLCYVEPFGGAAGVLLQKPRSYAEVYNDLDGDVVNFFRVLRDPIDRAALFDACVFTPYAREEFETAWLPCSDPIERARRLCIRAQMGYASTGATGGGTGFRIDTRRRYGTSAELWSKYPETIAAAGQRLSGVVIENRPAVDVSMQHDGVDTLHFFDPPYAAETRDQETQKRGAYRHDMDDAGHSDLLDALVSLKGMVVLSGYFTEMYDTRLTGWTRRETVSRISAHRGTSVRIECVWLNPACAAALANETSQQRMFA